MTEYRIFFLDPKSLESYVHLFRDCVTLNDNDTRLLVYRNNNELNPFHIEKILFEVGEMTEENIEFVKFIRHMCDLLNYAKINIPLRISLSNIDFLRKVISKCALRWYEVHSFRINRDRFDLKIRPDVPIMTPETVFTHYLDSGVDCSTEFEKIYRSIKRTIDPLVLKPNQQFTSETKTKIDALLSKSSEELPNTLWGVEQKKLKDQLKSRPPTLEDLNKIDAFNYVAQMKLKKSAFESQIHKGLNNQFGSSFVI